MKTPKSFVFYESWASMLEALPGEMELELLHAIFAYHRNGTCGLSDPILLAYFRTEIMPKMQDNARKYKDAVGRAAKAARARASSGSAHGPQSSESGKSSASNIDSISDDIDPTSTNIDEASSDIGSDCDNHDLVYVYVNDSDYVDDDVNVSVNKKDKRLKDKNPRELSLPTDPSGLPGEKERDGQAVSHPARKKPEDVRHRKGEFGHVMLTDKQLAELIRKHGEPETTAAIEAVDAYCEESGKTYHNYALVVERWGYDAARKGKNRKDGPPARDEPMSGNEFLLSMIREGGDGHADHD